MKRIVVAILVILMVMFFPAVSEASDYEKLRDRKVQYDEEREELLKRQKDVQEALEIQKRSTKALVNEIETLEKERQSLQEELEEAEQLYIQVLDEIDELTISIERENDSIDARDHIIRERMLAMQAQPLKVHWLYQVLGGESVIDTWDRYQKAKQLMQADRELIESQERSVRQLKDERQQFEQKKKEAEWTKGYLATQRELLQEQTTYQNNLLEKLQLRESELSNEESKIASRYEENRERREAVEEEMQQLLKRQIEETPIDSSPSETALVGATPAPPTLTPLPTEQIRCIDGLNEEQFRKRMGEAGVLSNSADAILRIATEHRIDPVLFAAITLHETGNGTSNAVRSYNNPGGMMNPKTNWSTLIRYPSLDAGLQSTAKTLDRLVNKGGLKTVEALGKVYAPVGAANDPTGLNRHWPSRVTQYINELGGMACQ